MDTISTRSNGATLRIASLASWLLVAAALGVIGLNGLRLEAAEFIQPAAAVDGMQSMWRILGGAACVLLVLWLPFALSWRRLPAVATGICVAGALLAVFAIPFFRATQLTGVLIAASIVLAVCALAQLAIRLPRN